MRITLVTLTALAGLLLVGCSKPSKLVGTWDASLVNGIPASFTFKPDGSMEVDADNPMAKTMKIKMLAKYHENGDKLYMTFTDVQFENTPAEAKAQEGEMKDALKKQLNVGTEKVTTVKWIDDNDMTSTPEGGQTTSYKRKAA